MSLRIKRLVLVGAVGLGLIVVVLVSLSLLLRLPSIQAQVRSQIQSMVAARFNLEVQFSSVQLDSLLRSVEISDLRVWAQGLPRGKPFLTVEEAKLYPSPWEFLRLRLRFNRVLLRGPKLSIQRSRQPGPGERPVTAFTPVTLTLPRGVGRFEIEDGEIQWQANGESLTLAGLRSDLRSSGAQLQGLFTVAETKVNTGAMSLLATDAECRIKTEGNDIQIQQLSATVMGSVIEAQGRLVNTVHEPAIQLALSSRGEVKSLFPRKPPVPMEGKFHLEGKLAGPFMDPVFTGRLEMGEGQLKHIEIVGLSLDVNADRDKLRLTQLNVRGEHGTLTGEATLIWESLRYQMNLAGQGVRLTRLLRPVTGSSAVEGHTTIDARIEGQVKNLSKLKGLFHLRVEEFHHLARPHERGHIRLILEGKDNGVYLRQLEASFAQTYLTANGTLEPGEQINMKVTARSSSLERIAELFGIEPQQLAGQAEFNGQLTGPLTAPVMKGHLQWTKAKLLGVALANVEGPLELTMAERRLKSPALEAVDGELHGKFNVALTLLPTPPQQKLQLKKDLELKIQGQLAGPWEKLLEKFFTTPLPTGGTAQLTGEIQGKPQSLNGVGTLVIKELTVLDMPWDRGQATVRLGKQKVFFEGVEIQKGEEKITGRSEIGFDGNVTGHISSTAISIHRMARIRDAGLTGTIRILWANSEGPVNEEDLSMEVQIGSLDYRGWSLGSGQGTFKWSRIHKRLTSTIRLPSRNYFLQGNVLTDANFPYNATLSLEKGDLVPLLRMFRDPLPTDLAVNATGRIDFSGHVFGASIPDKVNVNFSSAHLELHGHSFRTTGKTQLDFKDGRLTIVPLTLKGEGTDVTLQGTMGNEFDLAVRGSGPTALASLLSPEISDAKGLMELNMRIDGPRSHPRYHGRITSRNSSLTLRAHPEPLEKLSGEIRFTESSAESHDLVAQWGGGKILANLQGKRNNDGWNWPFQFKLENARLERVLIGQNNRESSVIATGELQADGSLNLIPKADQNWRSGLNGTVTLKATNGVIQRSFVLEKILIAINVTGLFRRGTSGRGMPYDAMGATFRLNEGIADSEDLELRSPSIRGGGKGKFNLVASTCDAYIAIQPLQLTDRIVRGATQLPLIKQLGIGSLLFGKDQSILIVTYHVHGPLSAPKLDHVPTKGADLGLLGIFERTLGLPRDLLRSNNSKSR